MIEGGNIPLNLKLKKIGECSLYLLQERALYSMKCKIVLAKKNMQRRILKRDGNSVYSTINIFYH